MWRCQHVGTVHVFTVDIPRYATAAVLLVASNMDQIFTFISIRWHRLHVIRVLPFTTASYSLARSESCAAQGAGPGRESRGEGARRDLRYVSAGGRSRGAAVACRSFAELSTVNSAKLPDALHASMQLQEPHSLVEYRSPRDAEVWCDEARQAAHGFAKRGVAVHLPRSSVAADRASAWPRSST